MAKASINPATPLAKLFGQQQGDCLHGLSIFALKMAILPLEMAILPLGGRGGQARRMLVFFSPCASALPAPDCRPSRRPRGGLTPNDWVVIGGVHLLRDKQKIHPIDREKSCSENSGSQITMKFNLSEWALRTIKVLSFISCSFARHYWCNFLFKTPHKVKIRHLPLKSWSYKPTGQARQPEAFYFSYGPYRKGTDDHRSV